uniref:Uncharacterized protein n=1 Tax=Oryza meridionalis TaxID=40149 RepID=A0A0E0CCX7_9ORYZ
MDLNLEVLHMTRQSLNFLMTSKILGEPDNLDILLHPAFQFGQSKGVQMGNEQRCQQEIEDTKHGLESGSITYDPAKLKFSDDIKDSRNENVPAAMAFHFLHTPVSYLHAVTPSDVDNLLRCNRWLSTSIVADDVRP